MLRKLFNSRGKVVTVAALVTMVAVTAALGLSGAVGLTNGKAPVSVTSSAVPIFTESSLPPIALFEQLAPFDVVLDAKEWKLVATLPIELGINVPGGYVYDKEGYAVVRVEKDGKIYVRDAKFELELPVPMVKGDKSEDIKWVRFRVRTTTAKDDFESTCCGWTVRASKEGTIDFQTGFFQLPWILEAEAEGILERLLVKPFTVYYLTWGFLGKDVIAPGASYGDFGIHVGLKNPPKEVEKAIELLHQMASGGEETQPPVEPECIICVWINRNFRAVDTTPFVKLFIQNLNRVPDRYRNVVMRKLTIALAALGGR